MTFYEMGWKAFKKGDDLRIEPPKELDSKQAKEWLFGFQNAFWDAIPLPKGVA